MREYADTKNFLDNILQSSTKYSIIGKDLNHNILSWNRVGGNVQSTFGCGNEGGRLKVPDGFDLTGTRWTPKAVGP